VTSPPGAHPLTPGKVRGLTATSTAGGIFTILAVDHRDAMRVALDTDHPQRVPPSTLTSLKLELVGELAAAATAVLLDPEYSAAQAIVTRALPGHVGFIAAVEAQGYLGDPDARQTSLLDGWSVEKAKRLGAAGIKLLVLYRPDSPAADTQDAMISAVVAECARHDIPLFLEPLAHALDPAAPARHAELVAGRRGIVVETVRRLGALRPDVLKVQFPVDTTHQPDQAVWADACAELDDVAAVPWALLSGGDPYQQFRHQVRIACAAGASGFMVGRALWGDYLTAPPASRRRLMDEVVRPRFAELAAIAAEHGRDWATRYTLPGADERWYLTY